LFFFICAVWIFYQISESALLNINENAFLIDLRRRVEAANSLVEAFDSLIFLY
jgi:hypothetical protein